jgi:peptidoglycan/LPS O-acetylase OafA/YrhL
MAAVHPATMAAGQSSPTTATPQKLYFPGLNGLRAVAASLVVLGHFDSLAQDTYLRPIFGGTWALGLAISAVHIFFVLSGFLLTYLLLAEKAQHGTISLSRFYLRRILRIWPLYYLILVIGYFLLPQLQWAHLPDWLVGREAGSATLVLYVAMQPHLVFTFYTAMHAALTILWSIGVEEAFYLFWPLLLKYIRKSLLVLLGVSIVFLVSTPVVGYILAHFLNDAIAPETRTGIENLTRLLRFDAMAFGGLAAYALYQNRVHGRFRSLIAAMVHPISLGVAILIVALFWSHTIGFKYFDESICAMCYTILVLHLVAAPKPLLPMENRLMYFLGRISYGIYVYHFFILFVVLGAWRTWGPASPGSLTVSLALLAIAYGLTVLIAYVSFTYFEQWFLRRKTRYERVASSASRHT